MGQKRDNLRMRKYLLLSLLTICSAQAFAGTVTNVRLRPDSDLIVTGSTNITFELGSAEPSGDGTSESAPGRVYVPMDGPSIDNIPTSYEEYRYLTIAGINALFTPTSSYTVNFPLYLNALSVTPVYLYAAIKEGTNSYKVAKQFSLSSYAGSTNRDEIFTLSTQEICAQVSDCANFVSTSGTEKKYLGYFYFSDVSGLALGSTVTPTTAGIYFEINMSNRIYQSSSTSPSITRIRPGDRRLTIEYSSNANILQPKAIRIVQYTSNPAGAADSKPFFYSAAASGALFGDEFTYASNGEVTVKDLFNGVDLYLGIVTVDLYKFGTLVSPTSIGTPKSIEELLKANNCFLLTAGFGENHFVIDYFRHFRDAVLVNTFLGREFIHFYYKLAPKYALLLYQSETLRALVRGAGYALYFIFNYYLIILFGALVSSYGIYLFKKREKIKI